MSIPKWDKEREETLKSLVGTESPVSVATVIAAAKELATTDRSVASKLRKMGYDVASMAKDTTKAYSDSEENELRSFLESNPGKYTYAEVAAALFGGKRTAKQIQGKILSMELTAAVKPTPKVEREKSFSDEDTKKLEGMLGNGKYIEDIAEAMGREVNVVRGKILSLMRTNPDITIPKQRNYKSRDAVDPLVALGDISGMTVAEIAEAIGKTERGVKTMLTHRSLVAKNYDGAKKAEKAAANAS